MGLSFHVSSAIVTLHTFDRTRPLKIFAFTSLFRQSIKFHLCCSLGSSSLRLKLPLLCIELIKLMLLNVAAKATCTTLRILVISFLRIWISIRSLIALLRFYEFSFLLVASISLLLGAYLPFLFVAFQKLMLLNFIDWIIAILINILLCGANWLIIFNQNCLSVDTIPLLTT